MFLRAPDRTVAFQSKKKKRAQRMSRTEGQIFMSLQSTAEMSLQGRREVRFS